MKTDRFAAALLAGLLLGPAPSVAGGIRIGRVSVSVDSPSRKWAAALAPQVGEVRKKLDDNRRALSTVQGPDGGPAYLRQEVAGLIVRTGEDLGQAIEKVQPSELEPLQAWAAAEVDRIREELAAVPDPKSAASSAGLFAPRPVAVVASLGGLPLPAMPKPETIPAGTSNQLLNELGKVVERIFVLASNDDLEVKLWVGSTPASRVVFSFWPQGNLKGSAPAPMIIRTDGKRNGIIRGLYSYRAAWSKGGVTDLIQYPNPAGAPSAEQSERLDLVNGTGFFCCRFGEHYCQQVANEKQCRP